MNERTLEHNTYLSCLLDDVTGTEEVVKLRQDICKIRDCFRSNIEKVDEYFTGSKAEGLDLPSSDYDYMIDINKVFDIEVSESIDELVQSTRANKFLLVTENVSPGFALLKCVSQIDNQYLRQSAITKGNNLYLGSLAFLSSSPLLVQKGDTRRIQGPSIEVWHEYHDTSLSGQDNVPSIRCQFWPGAAAEWVDRPRHNKWPLLQDIESITAFGCHLVPVGHPLSTNKSLEWRLSFSIAERNLTWSFNHTQIQCYAVMKLLLKLYIKVKCSETNKDVLCSYFIKTFLFWEFETKDQSFWQMKNFIGCLIYLFHEFYECIKTGVLRHYFVPNFNLLEIKLTREAQIELSTLFEYVVRCGISILGQCPSFSDLFTKWCQASDRSQCAIREAEILKYRILKKDETFMGFLSTKLACIMQRVFDDNSHSHINKMTIYLIAIEILSLINDGHISESRAIFVISKLCIRITIEKLYCSPQENKSLYTHLKNLGKNVYGTDLATSKLWLATFLLYQGDYCTALQKVNDVFSAISPYALYYSGILRTNFGSKRLYMDRYNSLTLTALYRAKAAWLMDINITQTEYPFMPRAIQIELDYCDSKIGIFISPYTYAYYLMSVCYHEMGQYEKRDRALHQLIETVHDDERCSFMKRVSYNIAVHYLLIAGYIDMARILFLQSANYTYGSILDKYNSAYHYLSYM